MQYQIMNIPIPVEEVILAAAKITSSTGMGIAVSLVTAWFVVFESWPLVASQALALVGHFLLSAAHCLFLGAHRFVRELSVVSITVSLWHLFGLVLGLHDQVDEMLLWWLAMGSTTESR